MPTNYRPIALLQAFYKFYTLLIDKRLRLIEHRVWRNQVGFRRDHSTDDANFLLLRLMEHAHRWQHLHIYILFSDWIKCYDRIHHAPLMDALRRFGLPPQYLRVLNSIYCDLSFFVADAWGKSAVLRQEQGLRQGDPLACFLLLISMTVIMLDCRDAFFAECDRLNFGSAHKYMERVFGFQDVGFADDTNLIQTHLPSLRVFVKCFLQEAAFYGFFANNRPTAKPLPTGSGFL